MNFDTLSMIVEELRSELLGGIIARVFERSAGETVLVVRKSGHNFYLLMSAERSLPRMHLLSAKPEVASGLHPFVLFLRSRIMGGRITGIGILNADRVVEIICSRHGAESRLLVELTGTSANLIVTDTTGKILAACYQVPLSDAGRRAVIPGIAYTLPVRKNRPAEEPDRSRSGRRGIAPRDENADGLIANRQAESLFALTIAQRKVEAERGHLRSLLKRISARTERRLNALIADKKGAENADEYRQAGELILANLKQLSAGINRAELTGFDGRKRSVILDPTRSPAGNAEQFFKRYKKAKSGRTVIENRLRDAADELSFLRPLLERAEQAEDEDSLAAVRSELGNRGYLRPDPGKKRKQHDTPAGSFKKLTYEGWEILIGKNARGNDHLTMSVARADDLWLHAEGLPGSHVLIRNPQKRVIPSEVVARAASLAAFYSKGRSAGKVPVAYTRAGHVRKPKGAKPGMVTLSDRRTLLAVPRDE